MCVYDVILVCKGTERSGVALTPVFFSLVGGRVATCSVATRDTVKVGVAVAHQCCVGLLDGCTENLLWLLVP